MRVRLALGVEEVLGLVMVGWGYIVMVSELSCSPAPMPLRVITIFQFYQNQQEAKMRN